MGRKIINGCGCKNAQLQRSPLKLASFNQRNGSSHLSKAQKHSQNVLLFSSTSKVTVGNCHGVFGRRRTPTLLEEQRIQTKGERSEGDYALAFQSH